MATYIALSTIEYIDCESGQVRVVRALDAKLGNTGVAENVGAEVAEILLAAGAIRESLTGEVVVPVTETETIEIVAEEFFAEEVTTVEPVAEEAPVKRTRAKKAVAEEAAVAPVAEEAPATDETDLLA